MIQDLISELAAGTVESGGWPELQPFLFLQPDTIANIRTRGGVVAMIFRESLPSPYLDSHSQESTAQLYVRFCSNYLCPQLPR